MKVRPDSRSGIATTLAAAVVIVLVAVGGGLGYYAYAGTSTTRASGSSTSSSTSSSATTTSVSSSSISTSTTPCCTTSSATTTSSSTSSSTSSTSTSTSTVCPTATTTVSTVVTTTTKFVLPACSSEIMIPPGIDTSNAENKITFLPENLTVVIGVNNTVFFVNQDMTSSLGHVIQSVQWPTNAQPFGPFELLPGWSANVTLTTPGVYRYQCTWHPVWMEGIITVVA